MNIGKSLFDKEGAKIVQSILDKAAAKGVQVTFPVDWLCGQVRTESALIDCVFFLFFSFGLCILLSISKYSGHQDDFVKP